MNRDSKFNTAIRKGTGLCHLVRRTDVESVISRVTRLHYLRFTRFALTRQNASRHTLTRHDAAVLTFSANTESMALRNSMIVWTVAAF